MIPIYKNILIYNPIGRKFRYQMVLQTIYIPILFLVGGFNPSEKYEFVSLDDDIPNWMEK